MPRRFAVPLLLFVLATSILAQASPAAAGQVEKSFPFALDRWCDVEVNDGPVTIHRVRVELMKGGVTKSSFVRPGNTDFLETVRVVVEYSNKDPKNDWKADLDVTWVDAAGKVIDGYRDDENIDNDARKEDIHAMISTLKYGLEKAKSLKVKIDFHPE
jgi:hypothetical protein